MKGVANRKRNMRLRFNLTNEEKELFERKRVESRAKNLSHFIRKTVLEKEIYEVDMTFLNEIKDDIRNATDFINQMAKKVNQTGVIYKSDVDEMKVRIDVFSGKVKAIHNLLLKR